MARQEVLDALDRERAAKAQREADDNAIAANNRAEFERKNKQAADLAALLRSELNVYAPRLSPTPILDDAVEGFLWNSTGCTNVLTVYYRHPQSARVEVIRFARPGNGEVVWVMTGHCAGLMVTGGMAKGPIDTRSLQVNDARTFPLNVIASQVEGIVEQALRDAGLIN